MEGHIAGGSTIVHDRLRGYAGAFDSVKDGKEVAVSSKVPEEESALENLNHLCSGVKWFLKKHRGIVKRYLEEYLSWYETLYNRDPSVEEFEDRIFGDCLQKIGNNT